tara:strand:+ start:103 stop:579 length:477 start_codon:yes stop_codon:yes gene_type:complete
MSEEKGRLGRIIDNLETLSENVKKGQDNMVKNIQKADIEITKKITNKQDKIDINTELVLKSITGSELNIKKLDVSGEIETKNIKLTGEETRNSNQNQVATKKYVDSIDNTIDGPITSSNELPSTATPGELRYSLEYLYVCIGIENNKALWKSVQLQDI